MKLSTKGRYGLRAMIDLAAHTQGEPVTLNSIATRENLSPNYLEHVFALLKKSGLVKSVKGAEGGYILSSSPDQISVGQILRALEGSLSVIEENPAINSSSKLYKCLQVNVWARMDNCLNELVDTLMLANLVNDYHKLNKMEANMYYI